MKISQTHSGKQRFHALKQYSMPLTLRLEKISAITQHLLNFTLNDFYFFVLSCTVGILSDIENVIEVAPATKVHVLFTVSFVWICF